MKQAQQITLPIVFNTAYGKWARRADIVIFIVLPPLWFFIPRVLSRRAIVDGQGITLYGTFTTRKLRWENIATFRWATNVSIGYVLQAITISGEKVALRQAVDVHENIIGGNLINTRAAPIYDKNILLTAILNELLELSRINKIQESVPITIPQNSFEDAHNQANEIMAQAVNEQKKANTGPIVVFGGAVLLALPFCLLFGIYGFIAPVLWILSYPLWSKLG